MFVYFLQVMLRWWWVWSRVKNSLYKCFIMMARGEKRPGSGPGCDHNGQLMNFNGHSLVTSLPVTGIINQITRLFKNLPLKNISKSFFTPFGKNLNGNQQSGKVLFPLRLCWNRNMQSRLAAVCWLIISNCQMGKLCKKRLVTAWRNDENYWSHGGLLGPGRCNGPGYDIFSAWRLHCH